MGIMLEIEEASSSGEVVVADLERTALKNCVSDGYIQFPLALSAPVSCSLLLGTVEGTSSWARGMVETSRSWDNVLVDLPTGTVMLSVAGDWDILSEEHSVDWAADVLAKVGGAAGVGVAAGAAGGFGVVCC